MNDTSIIILSIIGTLIILYLIIGKTIYNAKKEIIEKLDKLIEQKNQPKD